jgi:hypothetical protein
MKILTDRIFYFWRIEFKTWPPGPIMCCDWLKFQRTPLKPLDQWNIPAKFGSKWPNGFRGED